MTVSHEFDSLFQPGFVYASNRYFSINPLNGYLWFADGVSFFTNDQWRQLVGESDAAFVREKFPDPSRTIEKYALSLGLEAKLAAFMTEARLQSKQNWRPEFTAAVINRWVRRGFAVYCAADYNRDEALDAADFSAFLSGFQAQDARADINGDGVLNILDVVAFNGLMSQGCP